MSVLLRFILLSAEDVKLELQEEQSIRQMNRGLTMKALTNQEG